MMFIINYIRSSIKDLFIRPTHNLPSLDGLRAMAILLVLAMHTNEFFTHPGMPQSILSSLPPFKGGWIGVPLFFVLSGYLIGGQIWKEYLRDKTMNFTRFILRRGFRIWPLYYTLCVTIYVFALTPRTDKLGFISNMFFLSNYWKDDGPIFGAWSIATEEHFYIIAPIALLLLIKILGPKSLKFYRSILYIAFFAPLVARYFTWDFVLGLQDFESSSYMRYIYRPIHTHSEGLIGGLIISNIMTDPSYKISKYLNKRNLLAILALGLMLLSFKSKIYFNFTGVAIGFSFLLWLCLDSKNPVSRFFAHPIFFPISKTSFAIYLLHYNFITPVLKSKLFTSINLGPTPTILIGFFAVLVVVFAVSALLYIVIEKPFLELRRKVM